MLRVSSCSPVGCALTCSRLRLNVNRVHQLDGGRLSVCVAVYFELLFRQRVEFGLIVGITVLFLSLTEEVFLHCTRFPLPPSRSVTGMTFDSVNTDTAAVPAFGTTGGTSFV